MNEKAFEDYFKKTFFSSKSIRKLLASDPLSIHFFSFQIHLQQRDGFETRLLHPVRNRKKDVPRGRYRESHLVPGHLHFAPAVRHQPAARVPPSGYGRYSGTGSAQAQCSAGVQQAADMCLDHHRHGVTKTPVSDKNELLFLTQYFNSSRNEWKARMDDLLKQLK